MTDPYVPGFQPDLFPDLLAHTGRGSGSAMAAMLRQRREVATEPAAEREEFVRTEERRPVQAAK